MYGHRILTYDGNGRKCVIDVRDRGYYYVMSPNVNRTDWTLNYEPMGTDESYHLGGFPTQEMAEQVMVALLRPMYEFKREPGAETDQLIAHEEIIVDDLEEEVPEEKAEETAKEWLEETKDLKARHESSKPQPNREGKLISDNAQVYVNEMHNRMYELYQHLVFRVPDSIATNPEAVKTLMDEGLVAVSGDFLCVTEKLYKSDPRFNEGLKDRVEGGTTHIYEPG